jgi:TRAP-type C4-dicarboxylate transport system permease small subunit
MKAIYQLYEGLFKVVRWGGELCVFSMISLLVVDVIGRYVFHKSTLISYDLTGYYLVGITYLGAAYALREGSHIRITVITDTMRPRTRNWWLFFIDIVALFFIIILFVKSVDLVKYSLETGLKSTSFMGEPMWIPEIIVPIGLGMYILEDFRQLVATAKSLFFERNS